ncbi:MAG: hypothetical protein NHB32_12420 [Fischerella sp. CENA71]|nr:hypothetical protein [Fischerella sp. CENA71]
MSKITHKLFAKWWQLLESLQVEEIVARQVFDQLVAAYSSPGRYYHTLEHIQHVLNTIDTLQYQIQDFSAVKLAAWFHDVIYDTQAQDNEQQSAIYAVEVLKLLGLSDSIITKTKSLILNTKHHQAEPNDFDAQVLLDADLAILGSNPQHYRQYALLIRQEYAWLVDTEFISGRKQVLQQFLHRDRIYLTDLMFNKLESTARKNLKAELMWSEQISQSTQ